MTIYHLDVDTYTIAGDLTGGYDAAFNIGGSVTGGWHVTIASIQADSGFIELLFQRDFECGACIMPGSPVGQLHFDDINRSFDVLYMSRTGTAFGDTYLELQLPAGLTLQNVGAVPEPATWVLMLLGLAAIGLRQRWSQKLI